MKEDQPLICTRKPWDEEHPVRGLEKWLLKKTNQVCDLCNLYI